MKWRIIQRVDGRFEIHSKDRWYSSWRYRCQGSYSTLDAAIADLEYTLNQKLQEVETIKGRKILRIIKEFET